ncbi:U3 small nucleolar RNA-associated protein 25 [Massarina eburnea CBS 473.64]|uniref:U3 small nucleolar RNA-associated protein 25 n=1 Tax=Massarina eburnea CBS 473.64 TaxID=1395130 RepID=A0A6A6RL15_9PLEO|nr:U3 small nucleolar RNA-associated protein 25 [Massarina eburnea CBS 473.64]
MSDGQDEHSNPSGSGAESDTSQDSSSDDEEEAQPTAKAYNTLLQQFVSHNRSNAAEGEPRRKRRKLDHGSLTQEDDNVAIHHDAEDDAYSEEDLEPEEIGEEDEPESEEGSVEADKAADEEVDDAFEQHFEHPDENELAMRLAAIQKGQWTTKKLDGIKGGRGVYQLPADNDTAPSRRKVKAVNDIRLKPRLVENANKVLGDFDGVEQAVAPSLFGYEDVLFGARTTKNAERMRHMACLHALNHIVKTRDRVLKNNTKLAAASEDTEAEYRDQGFTRPKILYLLETKQAVVRAINSITQLYTFEQQENKKRFLDMFSLPEDKFSDDRPDDFRELFEGNDENEFRIGVKLTRKTLKFYSTFYNSDIIFASALGLRRAIESSNEKKKDSDFLSSIEMVIMEQADATLMQNWDHAEFIFEHLNLQPKDAHGCDFSRVRSWYLDGHAPYFRQIVVLSAYLTPKINTLYNKHMRNYSGRLKFTPDYTSGLIENLSYGIKQTFSRFDSPSHLTDPDARFKYFNTAILPQITRLPRPPQGGPGVLVFIPSYLDFVRVRNALVDSDLSYASISEYTDATDIRKARSHFMSGRHTLLLYTGRAHHFHRYSLRGVKRVVFYGLPENPRFYDEIVGFVGKTVEQGHIGRVEASVRVCFSKWERLELERIAGSKRVGKMIGDKGDMFDFV